MVKMGFLKVKKEMGKFIFEAPKSPLVQRIKIFIYNCLIFKKQIEKSKSSYYIFALFIMALNIPILMFGYYLFNDYINLTAQYSRYTISILALFLMLHELWTTKNPVGLWLFILFLALPLFSTYLFISSGHNVMWGVNCVLSIMSLFLFVTVAYAWLINILGIIVAILAYKMLTWVEGSAIILSAHISNKFFSVYPIAVLLITISYVIFDKLREDKIKEKLLETLGFSIAHSAKTPFSINVGFADLIKRGLKNDDYESIARYVNRLEAINTRAMQDVKTLLSTIGWDQHKRPDDWGEHSAAECIKKAMAEYAVEIEQKRVFFLNADDKEKDFQFIGSETLLKYMISHLINNALRYAGPRAKIEIFLQYGNIFVKNNGCGVDPKIYDTIFEKHVSTTRHRLGLYFCKQVMLSMDGDIECISKSDKGTQFTLKF